MVSVTTPIFRARKVTGLSGLPSVTARGKSSAQKGIWQKALSSGIATFLPLTA
jgi:hypothetical protein